MYAIDIYHIEDLLNLMDEECCINNDIIIRGNNLTSLGRLQKVNGELGIICETLVSLGQLEYVKRNLWISSGSKNLKSLNDLSIVDGDVNLRYSNINNLGKLIEIGGKLSIRDTEVNNLNNLKKIGLNLFLSKDLKDIDLSHIEIGGKVRYWNNIKTNIENKPDLLDVGGENFRYNINVYKNSRQSTSYAKYGWDLVWDSNLGFEIWLKKFQIPLNPRDKYYLSSETIEAQNRVFLQYKSQLDNNPKFIRDFADNYEVHKFRDRLIFDLLNELIDMKIDIDFFLERTFYYEKVFSISESISPRLLLEFLPLYELFDKSDIIIESITNYKHLLSYSKIHELELRFKKRLITGKDFIDEDNSNIFMKKYVNEYRDYADKKLQELYGKQFSFFYSLFSEIKTVEEINKQFPDNFKTDNLNLSYNQGLYYEKTKQKTKEAFDFLNKNKENDLFQKYFLALQKFGYKSIDISDYINTLISWENPLSYIGDDSKEFIRYLNDLIREFFILFSSEIYEDFRVSKGLPKKGEGWVSETELYYLIKDKFINIEVIHHGKPKWLGRQHVDIWIPEFNFGIEYQGKQHYEPIAFFGGMESFRKGQERDKRKRQLFKENNATLIEVKKGYDIELIFQKIEKIVLL